VTVAATAERLRRRLREGGAVATFLKLPTTEVVDLAVAAGFDCVVVDTEHSQLSERDARALISHAYALDLPAVVRIPAIDRGLVN
jgi:4-hydroxy-2-oxoheptanedioate aldolase